MDNNSTYGWIFIHNPYTDLWECTKREHYYELFSQDMGNVLRSSSPNVLKELIEKTGGDKAAIQTLLDEKPPLS